MGEVEKLLQALDFNAVHCDDVGVREYFAQSAEVIRKLLRETGHLGRVLTIERARLAEAIDDGDAVAGILERIVVEASLRRLAKEPTP